MPHPHSIRLDTTTYQQVTLLAGAWGLSPAQAVRRLAEHFQQRFAPATGADDGTDDGSVAVHAIYACVRIQGHYHPTTQSLTITEGPGAGHYKSPSGATTAVLRTLRPHIQPNRTGWDFWIINETGERLRTLRGTR